LRKKRAFFLQGAAELGRRYAHDTPEDLREMARTRVSTSSAISISCATFESPAVASQPLRHE
jgi:hypothetical protein